LIRGRDRDVDQLSGQGTERALSAHDRLQALPGAFQGCCVIRQGAPEVVDEIRSTARRISADHRSRARRWNDTVAELTRLQAEYDAWLQSLPENLQDTATAEALRTISELDLNELQAIVPPRGFGRD
jgi:phytoene dehydrogenase-like protein